MVWDDVNQNSVRDLGEPPLAGAGVVLRDEELVLLDSYTTLADGIYLFAGLLPDAYRVSESDPPGYGSTTPNEAIVLVVADQLTTVNFGDYLVPTATPTVTASATPTITPTASDTPTATASPTTTPVMLWSYLPLILSGL
jgi:hypothetical protein